MNFYKYLITIVFSLSLTGFAASSKTAKETIQENKSAPEKVSEKSETQTDKTSANTSEKKSEKSSAKAPDKKSEKPDEKMKTEEVLLKKTISKYQTKNGVKANVEKIVDNKIMNKKTKYEGTMSWYSGKFKWDCSKPEKSLLIFDGKYIWSITEDEFFDPKTQVTRTSIQSDDKKLLVNTFSEIMNRYIVKSNSTKGKDVQFELEAKKASNSLTKHISLVIEKEKNEIKELSYHDDLDNTTTIVFNSVSLNEKFKTKDFQYSPPKGVKVKDL